MVDVLERLRRFLELATAESANDHEARNAAMHVCRLIKQYDVKLSLERRRMTATEEAQAERDAETLRRNASFINDTFFEVFMQDVQREAEKRSHGPARPPPQPKVADPPRPKRNADPDAKLIPITFPAACRHCLKAIPLGAFAHWSRGELFHSRCWVSMDK